MTSEETQRIHELFREAMQAQQQAIDLAQRIDGLWAEAQRLNAKTNSVAWLAGRLAGFSATTTTPPTTTTTPAPTATDAIGPGQGLGGAP